MLELLRFTLLLDLYEADEVLESTGQLEVATRALRGLPGVDEQVLDRAIRLAWAVAGAVGGTPRSGLRLLDDMPVPEELVDRVQYWDAVAVAAYRGGCFERMWQALADGAEAIMQGDFAAALTEVKRQPALIETFTRVLRETGHLRAALHMLDKLEPVDELQELRRCSLRALITADLASEGPGGEQPPKQSKKPENNEQSQREHEQRQRELSRYHAESGLRMLKMISPEGLSATARALRAAHMRLLLSDPVGATKELAGFDEGAALREEANRWRDLRAYIALLTGDAKTALSLLHKAAEQDRHDTNRLVLWLHAAAEVHGPDKTLPQLRSLRDSRPGDVGCEHLLAQLRVEQAGAAAGQPREMELLREADQLFEGIVEACAPGLTDIRQCRGSERLSMNALSQILIDRGRIQIRLAELSWTDRGLRKQHITTARKVLDEARDRYGASSTDLSSVSDDLCRLEGATVRPSGRRQAFVVATCVLVVGLLFFLKWDQLGDATVSGIALVSLGLAATLAGWLDLRTLKIFGAEVERRAADASPPVLRSSLLGEESLRHWRSEAALRRALPSVEQISRDAEGLSSFEKKAHRQTSRPAGDARKAGQKVADPKQRLEDRQGHEGAEDVTSAFARDPSASAPKA
jgi:hypothetical protein